MEVMRFIFIILLVLLLAVSVEAGGATYETIDGEKISLKKIDGSVHPRTGSLGPGQNLRWIALQDTDLRRANLSFADLRNATLQQADLRNANLHGAVLGGVTLRGANLRNCDLSGAQLNGADIRDVLHWDRAVWKGARYVRGSEPQWPKGFSPVDAGVVIEKPR